MAWWDGAQESFENHTVQKDHRPTGTYPFTKNFLVLTSCALDFFFFYDVWITLEKSLPFLLAKVGRDQ